MTVMRQAAAEIGLEHGHDRETGARAQEPVVVGEDVGGQGASDRRALALDAAQLGLHGGEAITQGLLHAGPFRLGGLQPALGVLDLTGQTLLPLHQGEDLLLDPGLLLLDLLDLGENGGVLLVGLDLVELALELLPLHLVVLEVLFLGARVLAGGVEAGLGAVHRLPRLGGVRAHRLDLLGELRRFGLEPGDAGVEGLELDEGLQLAVHVTSPELVGPLGLEPRPDRL